MRRPTLLPSLPRPTWPARFPDFRSAGRVRPFVVAAALLPCIVAGGASGAYYYQMHRLCMNMTVAALPTVAPSEASRRVLVLSPHCDDETLGAGGLIADARRSGASVRVAFLTNGDGFRVAASRTLGEPLIGPSDFVRFAEVRQSEAVSALRELGVAETSVDFLGYPDRGLQAMWETHWETSHPFRSGFTGHTRSPYKRTFTPKTVYCGASLVADLTRLMREYHPTDILVTHPADDHTDHFAAAAFAEAALRASQHSGDNWAKKVRLRYYIVHRGNWPLPQGSHPDQPLPPPPGLLGVDTRWSTFPLDADMKATKSRALEKYRSQTGVSGRFLRSFVRSNELIAQLPHLSLAPSTGTKRFAVAPDPSGDNVARFADPAADLTGVSLMRDGAYLRVQVRVRGRVSPRVRYQVRLRTNAEAAGMDQASQFALVNLPAQSVAPDGKTLEERVLLSQVVKTKMNPDSTLTIWGCAQTSWAGTPAATPPADRTGYRVFEFHDKQNTTLAEARQQANECNTR